MQNRESCVNNGGTTTNYFQLERGTRQDDPIQFQHIYLYLF